LQAEGRPRASKSQLAGWQLARVPYSRQERAGWLLLCCLLLDCQLKSLLAAAASLPAYLQPASQARTQPADPARLGVNYMNILNFRFLKSVGKRIINK